MFRILCHLVALSVVCCQYLNDARTLHRDLLANYTKTVIPIADYSKPLEINVTFYIVSLNYFKEVDETASLIGCPQLQWADSLLTWDPSAYGGLTSFVFDTNEVWVPSLFLINRADSMKPIGHDVTFPALVFNTGNVYYGPGDILEAKCPTDIAKFPFDTQECTLDIMAWGITSAYLKIRSTHANAQLDWYTENSDWTLLEYSTYTGNRSNYNIFYLKLKIKRQPLYYGVIIILPTILFAVLNPFVFVLPVESGERVGLAMTILLSYAIFLTLVTASIPASSNPMCVLLVIMIVIIAISGMITAGTIISAKYYFQDDISKTPRILKYLANRRLQLKQKDSVLPINGDKDFVVSGKDISDFIDCVLFYGSYVVLFLTTVTFFFYSPL